jgi:hypothetical protein
MTTHTLTLEADDFIDRPNHEDEIEVILDWSHSWERIEVLLQGVDIYNLINENSLEGLTDSYNGAIGIPEIDEEERLSRFPLYPEQVKRLKVGL